MKIRLIMGSVVLAAVMLAGCTPAPAPAPAPAPQQTETEENTEETQQEAEGETEEEQTDAVTTASIVDEESAFEKAISKDGTWIIATLKDLTFDKDLVLEGEFKNERDEIQRKIALYTQDSNRNVTNRFTLTAPSLTIKSPNARIQHGNFKGNLYVETTDFQLVDTKVDGDIYFTSEEARSGFKMDAESSISGIQEVKN